ncbi:transposase [Enterococcus faecalis]|nr:transposase [Enterococcus faecalis]MDN3177283.1 transposase [Enterococcus faecalis]
MSFNTAFCQNFLNIANKKLEGKNNLIKVIKRVALGFRPFATFVCEF